MPERRRRNSLRLAGHDYGDSGYACFVTFKSQIKHLKPDSPLAFNAPLTYPTLAERIIEALNHYRQTYRWWVYAYCVMPDHVHMLATPRDGHNLSDTLGAVESYVVRLAWELGVIGKLWQRSFHDSILRPGADPSKVIAYILHNPVRAGLCARWEEWPWLGMPDPWQ